MSLPYVMPMTMKNTARLNALRGVVLLSCLSVSTLAHGQDAGSEPSADVEAVAPAAAVSLVEAREAAIQAADELEGLHTLIVARDGEAWIEEGFEGRSVTTPTNIKSASKSIVSAMVGIAIDKGLLEGVDQPIAPLLEDKIPDDADPRINGITIGHLLSMQAGLGRTSGENYGRWIASSDWVRAALAEPFADDPGGRMLYSTGSTHLLSAILMRVGEADTMELANEWLGMDGAFRVTDWERDPQGIPLGGNQMAVSPRSLLAFGEMYRNGGIGPDGERVVSQQWIDESWERRTSSVFSGEAYGYSWFLRDMAGVDCFYAWGYGGQMLYILPELEMTVVVTSEENRPSARSGYRDDLHALVEDRLVRPVLEASGS